MKTFTINFSDFAKETSLRFDVDFLHFQIQQEKRPSYLFKDLFEVENFEKNDRMKLLEEIGDDDFYYSEIGNATKQGDVEPVKLNFNDRNELVEDYFKKIEKGDIQKVEENNILLAKVRPNLKKYIFVDEEKKKYFYTTAFINLKPKSLNKILYYSFITIFYENLMAISRQGKGYPTLKEDDLFTLKFDKNIIDKFKQTQYQIVSQIEPIEKEIKNLKSQIKDPKEIINEVFAREFGFDLEKFEESKKEKFFEVDLSKILKDEDLRFSVSSFKFIEKTQFLSKKFNLIKLGNIISLEYGSALTEQNRIVRIISSNGFKWCCWLS